jgi:hypothetical protein
MTMIQAGADTTGHRKGIPANANLLQSRGEIEWVDKMLQRAEPARLKQTAGVLKSFAVGIVAFSLGTLADWLSRDVLHGAWRILDDIVLSIFAGLIVLWYERLRTRELRQRIITARQINHHVRNELQTVVYAAEVQKDERLGTIVRNTMERIDWTLKEVLTETGRSHPVSPGTNPK